MKTMVFLMMLATAASAVFHAGPAGAQSAPLPGNVIAKRCSEILSEADTFHEILQDNFGDARL